MTLAVRIAKEKVWDELPQLADMLEAAGCQDREILEHLRERDHTACRTPWRLGGCFEGQCWLINAIAQEPQPVVAMFKWKPEDAEQQRATVINPGDWWGQTWLIYVADCMSPPLYVVEADGVSSVLDEFIDSPHGESERLNPDDEWDNKDYGFQVHAGDMIGGKVCDKDGWLDLRGNYVEGERTEPSHADGGHIYDGDNIEVKGREIPGHAYKEMPFPVTYFGPGIPLEGISPLLYYQRGPCSECGKECFPFTSTKIVSDTYCSAECRRENLLARGFSESDIE